MKSLGLKWGKKRRFNKGGGSLESLLATKGGWTGRYSENRIRERRKAIFREFKSTDRKKTTNGKGKPY